MGMDYNQPGTFCHPSSPMNPAYSNFYRLGLPQTQYTRPNNAGHFYSPMNMASYSCNNSETNANSVNNYTSNNVFVSNSNHNNNNFAGGGVSPSSMWQPFLCNSPRQQSMPAEPPQKPSSSSKKMPLLCGGRRLSRRHSMEGAKIDKFFVGNEPTQSVMTSAHTIKTPFVCRSSSQAHGLDQVPPMSGFKPVLSNGPDVIGLARHLAATSNDQQLQLQQQQQSRSKGILKRPGGMYQSGKRVRFCDLLLARQFVRSQHEKAEETKLNELMRKQQHQQQQQQNMLKNTLYTRLRRKLNGKSELLPPYQVVMINSIETCKSEAAETKIETVWYLDAEYSLAALTGLYPEEIAAIQAMQTAAYNMALEQQQQAAVAAAKTTSKIPSTSPIPEETEETCHTTELDDSELDTISYISAPTMSAQAQSALSRRSPFLPSDVGLDIWNELGPSPKTVRASSLTNSAEDLLSVRSSCESLDYIGDCWDDDNDENDTKQDNNNNEKGQEGEEQRTSSVKLSPELLSLPRPQQLFTSTNRRSPPRHQPRIDMNSVMWSKKLLLDQVSDAVGSAEPVCSYYNTSSSSTIKSPPLFSRCQPSVESTVETGTTGQVRRARSVKRNSNRKLNLVESLKKRAHTPEQCRIAESLERLQLPEWALNGITLTHSPSSQSDEEADDRENGDDEDNDEMLNTSKMTSSFDSPRDLFSASQPQPGKLPHSYSSAFAATAGASSSSSSAATRGANHQVRTSLPRFHVR